MVVRLILSIDRREDETAARQTVALAAELRVCLNTGTVQICLTNKYIHICLTKRSPCRKPISAELMSPENRVCRSKA